jgi:TolA-binding protein
MKTRWTLLTIAALAMTQAACLKTRTQIKGGGESAEPESSGETESKEAPRSGRYELEEMRNEITRVSGKVEVLEHSQRSQNYQELKEYSARLDGRIAELEKNQLILLTEVKALKDEKAAAAREAAVPATDLSTSAAQLLKEGKYEAAAEKYRALLNKGLKGKEAAEAHFGLAESEYGLKNFKKAIVQYSKVQEAFSKSTRIPTSLYKIGVSFQQLNMPKESKNFFAELLERYPKSPEAKRARAKAKE